MRREERVTVQGPAKKQQPDEMSQGVGGVKQTLLGPGALRYSGTALEAHLGRQESSGQVQSHLQRKGCRWIQMAAQRNH